MEFSTNQDVRRAAARVLADVSADFREFPSGPRYVRSEFQSLHKKNVHFRQRWSELRRRGLTKDPFVDQFASRIYDYCTRNLCAMCESFVPVERSESGPYSRVRTGPGIRAEITGAESLPSGQFDRAKLLYRFIEEVLMLAACCPNDRRRDSKCIRTRAAQPIRIVLAEGFAAGC